MSDVGRLDGDLNGGGVLAPEIWADEVARLPKIFRCTRRRVRLFHTLPVARPKRNQLFERPYPLPRQPYDIAVIWLLVAGVASFAVFGCQRVQVKSEMVRRRPVLGRSGVVVLRRE